jgi:two-component system, cell cycle response regulator DivK
MNQHFLNNHTPEKLNRIHFDWNNKTILIAEDEEMNFLYLKEVLRKSNVNILHARDGEEAITVFKECEGGIDLIIMDIKMPKVDGIEATQAIKTINPAVPIIAHTAYAMEDDKQRCLRAGCDNYVSKPINKDLFLNILNEYLTEN